MKRIMLVLLALMVCFGLTAQIKFSGSTGATVYHDDESVGVLDADQDVTLAYGPLSLALNAGYTYTFATLAQAITFGYTLSVAQPVGPFTFSGSIASNALTQAIGGAFTGDFLGDMKATVDLKMAEGLTAKAYSLFTAKKGYPIFMGVDVSASYAPKWGAFTVGGSFLDPKAVTDAVGYVNAVAAVKGLSFYAKAKVTY